MEFRFDEETHIGWWGNTRVKSTTTILKEEGFMDSRWWTEYARLKGTYTHDAIHLELKNDLVHDSIDPAIHGRFTAFKKFRDDTGFELIDTEVRNFSSRLMFTGKHDLRCWLFGSRAIIDFKPWSIQYWVAYQLASYCLFYPEPHKRYALRLGDDGRYKLEPFTDRNDTKVFLAALTINLEKEKYK